MAFIQCSFHSEVLGIASSMNVILPQSRRSDLNRDGGFPVLYLFHGLSDDYTIWHRRTSIERYVEGKNIAVVMPGVNRSFYADMKYGYKYWTFISEELPEITRSLFPISDKREDNFVAGLSMGGYGALKLALNHPDRYAAAASLSGAVDVVGCFLQQDMPELEIIFGNKESVKGSSNDLFFLAEKIAASADPKPRLYQCCGTEDFLYQDNINFLNHCRKLSLDLTYEEEPGNHNWAYWDMKIQRVLEWLPVRNGNQL